MHRAGFVLGESENAAGGKVRGRIVLFFMAGRSLLYGYSPITSILGMRHGRLRRRLPELSNVCFQFKSKIFTELIENT
jgi:hypothetical protein